MKKDKVKQSTLLPTIEFSGFPSVRFLCSLVVSSFFPLFWSVLFWSAPALPSYLFLLAFHPSSFPGGWTVTVLFRCLSLLLPWPGDGGVVLFSPVPVPSGVRPCLPCRSFAFGSLVGSVRFCTHLSGFPSFLFLPSLLVSLSFLISFFPRAGGGGPCSVFVASSSFILSSFLCLFFFRPPPGGVVMFCFVPPFPYFLLYLFFPSSFFPRSFLPCAGVWLVTFLVCAAPLFLYSPFVPPFFLPPLWLAQIRKSNSR